MTVIAALHQNGETWIGSDSQRDWGGARLILGSKVIAAPGIAMGCSGNSKLQLLIRKSLDVIVADHDEWGVAKRIRAALDDDKWAHMTCDDGKGPANYGMSIALATPSQVFLISADFMVQPFADGDLMAVGSGADYAIGAGEVLRAASPEARVRAAIQTAIKWDTGCGGDAHVMRVPAALPAAAAQAAAQAAAE